VAKYVNSVSKPGMTTGMHTGRHTDRHVWTPYYWSIEAAAALIAADEPEINN